jgi:hypothetical protein
MSPLPLNRQTPTAEKVTKGVVPSGVGNGVEKSTLTRSILNPLISFSDFMITSLQKCSLK